ncbi:MAG TPA: GHMP kinase [bacterium]|nr:GHMP kinase [bacterium]
MKLFVPGRICLFGEHSDWAGGYRRINAELAMGRTLITGTNQGIHAEVRPHPGKLILTTTLNDGTQEGPHEIPMDLNSLLGEARKGGFFSYAAGVAYQILTHYQVQGLEIHNFKTDLPIKKGLSSSAAICVLVARAFNRIYDLKMTIRGEMEYAYLGEITTPSRCGRMDQGCAYGNRPVAMTYDGDRIDVTELKVPKALHYVIVDLHAGKDTREILSKLNRCYPFADDDLQRGVQEYLGPVNWRITGEAVEAVQEGDAERLGALMNEAQGEFDRRLGPACPSQLTAPALHRLLNYEPIRHLILGGKGVGSQGDGTAQLLVRNAEDQKEVIRIIETDLGMSGLELVIGARRQVRKAVIPAAGFGTGLFPASNAVKKELFPVIDRNGRAVPAILTVVEEAAGAGIEEIAILVHETDRHLFEDFFTKPPRIENFNRLPKPDQKRAEQILDLGRRITFLNQDRQEGFGHAVHCAKAWIDGEPFLLLLGDHLYVSETDIPCARQLLDAYEQTGYPVIGLGISHEETLRKGGAVAAVRSGDTDFYTITEFTEKPAPTYAQAHLRVDGLRSDEYLTIFGQYILPAEIMDILGSRIEAGIRDGGEFGLTSALDLLRKQAQVLGIVLRGRRYDIGTPEDYLNTLDAIRRPARP